MARAFAEIAFTQSVRAIQRQQGSADNYAGFLAGEIEHGDRLGAGEIAFIEARDGFYQATLSETGWPYVQFRGGPTGFLKVLDEQTIAYADFRGNRQYLSTGNLAVNSKISLILMDYPNRRRLKIWGQAKLVDKAENVELVASLQIKNYRSLTERAVVISIEAYDWNCPQHIPQRFTKAELDPILTEMRDQITKLQAENKLLETELKRISG